MNSNWLEVQNICKFLWIFFSRNWNQTHGFTMQRGFTVLAPTPGRASPLKHLYIKGTVCHFHPLFLTEM